MKKIYISALVVLLVVIAGCNREEAVVEKRETVNYIKVTEDALQGEWEEKMRYTHDASLTVIEGSIIKSTMIPLGNGARVTVFGVDWVSADPDAPEIEDMDLGHTELQEKYFVRVFEYGSDGSLTRESRY